MALNYKLNNADTSFRIGAQQYKYPGSWSSTQYSPIDSSATSAESLTGAESSTGVFGSLGLGLAVGSAISNVASAFIGARAQAAVQKSQAKIAKNNAIIMQMGVEQAYRQGEAQIGKITREAGRLKGKQKAAMAANGVAIGVGSSAELLASTDIQKEEDVNTARLNAIANAWGYRSQALSYGAQSSALNTVSSYNKGAGAYGSAFSSFLDSASKVASSWYQFKGGR